MDVFEMVVWIVVVSCITGVITTWLKSRSEQGGDVAAALSKDQDEKIAALEDRIQVLERLVTDNREALKREIDAL